MLISLLKILCLILIRIRPIDPPWTHVVFLLEGVVSTLLVTPGVTRAEMGNVVYRGPSPPPTSDEPSFEAPDVARC